MSPLFPSFLTPEEEEGISLWIFFISCELIAIPPPTYNHFPNLHSYFFPNFLKARGDQRSLWTERSPRVVASKTCWTPDSPVKFVKSTYARAPSLETDSVEVESRRKYFR